jgi:hypothetical protein
MGGCGVRITNEYIASLFPCKNRHDNYLHHYRNTDFSVVEFLQLENITYDDKIWVWKNFATVNEAALFGLKCASSVLDIFEAKYPNDERPRLALEAVYTYLKNPTEENKKACSYAADYAADAADDADDAYAYANAAYVAAAADDAYAAYAAAAYAAYVAADYAADHAADHAAASRLQQKEVNLIFLVEIYQDKEAAE